MIDYAVVSNRQELKEALERKADIIIVSDSKLARSIQTVKLASRAALAAAIAGAGVAATNFWNPVGWGVAVVGVVAGSTTLVAVVALGLGAALVFIIRSEYRLKAKGAVKMPDGTEIKGEIVLEKC